MSLRVLGLSEGSDRTAMSGVAGYVFDALERRGTNVQRLDYSPRGVVRAAVATATFRPRRSAWVARFHTSRTAHRALTRTLADRVRRDARPFDVALQIHGWTSGQPDPYALFVDQTRLMAERGWPQWIPLTRRERDQVLRLEAEMYAGAAHIFTMGLPAKASLLEDYGVGPEKISVVGGGLNLPGLPPPRRPSLEPRVIFVGRDFERKGGDRLLKAFAIVRKEVPGARLDLVGVGRSIARPGVVNHGRVGDRALLTSLYESARVFCMPSRYEPWGLVFAEAMAHSVPCVGSDVQSIPEILDHGRAGRLVPPDEVDRLAAALIELLTDDELALELGARGRSLIESSQTWDHVAARMEPGLRAAAGR